MFHFLFKKKEAWRKRVWMLIYFGLIDDFMNYGVAPQYNGLGYVLNQYLLFYLRYVLPVENGPIRRVRLFFERLFIQHSHAT